MNNMAAIAEGYMDIDDATIKNKKSENKDDAEAFNREIIRIWRNRYSGSNQVKVSRFLFIHKMPDIKELTGRDPDQLTRS